MNVTNEMVANFLSWTLPNNFSPDGGISFSPFSFHRPSGTNLFNAEQARQMLEHVLGGIPEPTNTNTDIAMNALRDKCVKICRESQEGKVAAPYDWGLSVGEVLARKILNA